MAVSSARLKMFLWIALSTAVVIPAVHACSMTLLIWSMESETADPLFRIVRAGKVGYINAKGRIIVKPTLPLGDKYGGEFHEGLLALKDGQGNNYIDRTGAIAFHTNALFVRDFSNGLAAVGSLGRASKWGFIDRTGRLAIPAQYDRVNSFSEGLARVSVSGEFGSSGYIDTLGTFVIPPRMSYGGDFHEGLAAVIIDGPCRSTNDGSCGSSEFRPSVANAQYDCRVSFINRNGVAISDLRFDAAMDFSEGLAAVKIGALWGYIDKSGRIAIPPRFEGTDGFSDGLAAAVREGKTGYIDHTGRFVIPPQFDGAHNFSNGRAPVFTKVATGWIGRFIDKSGKIAFPGEFALATPFRFGLANVSFGGDRFAWIDTSGHTVFAYSER